MIISEKQITHLTVKLNDYINLLKNHDKVGQLTEAGKVDLENCINLLLDIYNQQSDELKDYSK